MKFKKFDVVTVDEVLQIMQKLIDTKKLTRTINKLHMHHTYIPDHNHFEINKNKYGDDVYRVMQESMEQSHKDRGFGKKGDIVIDGKGSDWGYSTHYGIHLTLFPNGKIGIGRDFNEIPASIKGYNTNGLSCEIIGNFDNDNDKLEGIQREVFTKLFTGLNNILGLKIDDSLMLHNEHSTKTCPGTSIDKQWLLNEIKKGETMEDRINIRIEKDNEEILDLDKDTISRIEKYIDPFSPFELRVLYEYVGCDIVMSGKYSVDSLNVQKVLNKTGAYPKLIQDGYFGNGSVSELFKQTKSMVVTKKVAAMLNSALLELENNVIHEPTVITPDPINEDVEPIVDDKTQLYNKAIPQLVYKGVINYNKTSSFKSTQTMYLQRALQSLGYYRVFTCDKKRGNGTIIGIKDLKTEMRLSPHGNTLTEDDIFKINKKLILDFHKYHDGKYGIESWKIPKNSTYTSIVVKINPSRLDITIGDKVGSRYIEDNLITSSYQWWNLKTRKMNKYGITITKGETLKNMQVHYKPTMTLFTRGGKHFDVKTVLYVEELGSGVEWADAGLELYPDSNAYVNSGFVGRYSDVIGQRKRPYNFKLNGELYFGVHPSMSNKTANRMGKAMILGFINSWDAGGSTLLKIAGVWYYTTTRRLYQLVKF